MQTRDLNRDTFISELFKSIDAMDAKAFATFLTPEGAFTFGNWPTATGTAAIVATVDQFYGTINQLTHRVESVWSDKDVMFVEGNVTYVRKDGKAVGPLPFMNRFKMTGDKVRDYRVFADVSALFQ